MLAGPQRPLWVLTRRHKTVFLGRAVVLPALDVVENRCIYSTTGVAETHAWTTLHLHNVARANTSRHPQRKCMTPGAL